MEKVKNRCSKKYSLYSSKDYRVLFDILIGKYYLTENDIQLNKNAKIMVFFLPKEYAIIVRKTILNPEEKKNYVIKWTEIYH